MAGIRVSVLCCPVVVQALRETNSAVQQALTNAQKGRNPSRKAHSVLQIQFKKIVLFSRGLFDNAVS
jgi:hypothetical protein